MPRRHDYPMPAATRASRHGGECCFNRLRSILRAASVPSVHAAARALMARSSMTLLPLLALSLSLLLAAPLSAHAQLRAWLDRDRIAVGETTTLNIETDEAGAGAPDYAALQRDFEITGNTSSRQFEIDNGRSSARMLFAVALQPKRDGALTVPALRVGSRSTAPLSLTVNAAAPSRSGEPVFIEAEADDTNPYVQQAVGYTLKLYYDQPILSGQFDQDAPDGASLQRLGNDLQYTQVVGARRYTVIERRFLLIPERSGTLTIPGGRFQGRTGGGLFEDVFGDGQRSISARGAPRFLTVRAAPANAPQPWLPLRGLNLRYASAPQTARAGDAFEVIVELNADGATGAQLPDLQLPAIDGAQVFADPPQVDERVDGGRPKVKLTRKFSVVPARAGTLRIPGPRIAWFDVRAAATRSASLPNLSIAVTPALAGGGAAPVPLVGANDGTPGAANAPADATTGVHVPGVDKPLQPWALTTVVFALLWLATLVWGLQRRGGATPLVVADRIAGDAISASRPGLRGLKQALDTGDLGDVADALCALAQPPVRDLDALLPRLARADQRAAVTQLQRARWGGGDAPATRAALREAFASGPEWVATPAAESSVLPPLYPPG